MMIRIVFLSFMLILIFGQIKSQQTIGLFLNTDESYNGYTLWTVGQNSYLIDNCGYEINSWSHTTNPGLSAYLLGNGNLMRAGRLNGSFNGAGAGGLIEEYDWEGNLVWSYELSNNQYQQHHDIEPLPNGNFLAIAWERKVQTETDAAGSIIFGTYWPEVILEIEKIGTNEINIVWEWHVWDHLIQDHDNSKENFGIVSDHPELMDINFNPPMGGFGGGDWLHFNSVDYDPIRDEIIISARHIDEMFIIDHSTTTEEAAGHTGGNRNKGGDFLYRWGNPRSYNMGTNQDKKLFGQHDAQVIPQGFPGEGNISIFNNGDGRPDGNYSSVEEFSPPRDSDGNYFLENGVFGPEDFTWQYIADPPEDLFSGNMAGAHRLENGNTLICEANAGTFLEVDQSGETVWLYQNTSGANGPLMQGQVGGFGTSVFRVTRYNADFVGFDGKDLSPGNPIEINPLDYECMIYNISANSEQSSIDQNIQISYNPQGQLLEIHNPNTYSLDLHLLDFTGRLILTKKSNNEYAQLDMNHLPSGAYVLYLNDKENGHISSSKIIKF